MNTGRITCKHCKTVVDVESSMLAKVVRHKAGDEITLQGIIKGPRQIEYCVKFSCVKDLIDRFIVCPFCRRKIYFHKIREPHVDLVSFGTTGGLPIYVYDRNLKIISGNNDITYECNRCGGFKHISEISYSENLRFPAAFKVYYCKDCMNHGRFLNFIKSILGWK